MNWLFMVKCNLEIPTKSYSYSIKKQFLFLDYLRPKLKIFVMHNYVVKF